MSLTTITLAGQPVTLCALPAPLPRAVSFDMTDSVALVGSPFTGQTQAQKWPGADMWSGSLELPALCATDAQQWRAFLAEMRGMANAVQLADPSYDGPQGNPLFGAGFASAQTPGTVTDVAGNESLHTVGWQPNAFGVLLPGDYLQVGYRLHMVTEPVNPDGSGDAAIGVWPSLREAPAANAPILTANPMGLFRLGNNKRGWSADYTKLHTFKSVALLEYR